MADSKEKNSSQIYSHHHRTVMYKIATEMSADFEKKPPFGEKRTRRIRR